MTELDGWIDRVHEGDCLDVLRELPDYSVDLCATDPPYGIAFMSKTWDSDIPARAIWAEVFRVLKPGASCFVCAGARQDTILGLLTDLREVGFDIQHAALSWVYWNGFPKSSCVSKQCDKAAFLAWLRETPDGETQTRQALMGWDAADVRKAASAAVNGAYSADPAHDTKRAGLHGALTSIAGQNERPWNDEAASGHPGTGTLLLAALQARFGDAPGVRESRGIAGRTGGGRKCMNCTPETGRTKDCLEGECNATSPATPEAVEWDGWHSGSVPLKPASEQILWVTKPAEPGPARNNVLKWGTGACNIGECRVPFDGADSPAASRWGGLRDTEPTQPRAAFTDDSGGGPSNCTSTTGARYPSNLLVSARALGDDSKYGDLDAWAREHGISEEWLDVALSAGVLRVPKPSRSEKNAGCEGLEEKFRPTRDGGPDARSVNTDKRGAVCRNHHPTTKPLTLMAYLCTLACPRGGIVLDPFLGSGTTAVAATQSGMHYIGIEREPEYVAIAEARIAAALRDRQPALDL